MIRFLFKEIEKLFKSGYQFYLTYTKYFRYTFNPTIKHENKKEFLRDAHLLK